jgi:hypothetical protein
MSISWSLWGQANPDPDAQEGSHGDSGEACRQHGEIVEIGWAGKLIYPSGK